MRYVVLEYTPDHNVTVEVDTDDGHKRARRLMREIGVHEAPIYVAPFASVEEAEEHGFEGSYRVGNLVL